MIYDDCKVVPLVVAKTEVPAAMGSTCGRGRMAKTTCFEATLLASAAIAYFDCSFSLASWQNRVESYGYSEHSPSDKPEPAKSKQKTSIIK